MRYFSASVMNGRIYLHYVNGALTYRTTEEIEGILNPSRDRRIHSVEELDEVLRDSVRRPLPLGMIYVAEGLEEEARRILPR